MVFMPESALSSIDDKTTNRSLIPVKYIGLGEKIQDLQIFHPDEFVRSLFGNAI